MYERAKSMLEARLGEDLVTLDVDRGTCFSFNEVAARIWDLLEQPKSLGELEAVLAEEFEVDRDQCRAESRALLDELVALGLVRERDPRTAPSTSNHSDAKDVGTSEDHAG